MKRSPLTSLVFVVVFLFCWGIYLKTLCPTLYVGDSGELIAGGYSLGIPHPPGYPLYELVGRLFSLIPLGEIAFRFNLLSCFFSTTAVITLMFYLRLLYGNLVLGTALALTGAWGVAVWEMAVTTEVYPLASFLFLAVLILLYWGKTSEKRGYLYLAAVLYGLGLCAHYSFILFFPGVIVYFFWVSSSQKTIKSWLTILMLGLLGWLTFSYLPLRAINQPPINWGNPLSYPALLNHIKRAEYKEVTAVRSLSLFFKQFYYLFLNIKAELPLFSGFLAFLGLPILYRKKRAEFWLTTLISLVVILLGAYFLNYDSLSRARGFGPKFFIPFYAMLLIFLGAILNWIAKRIGDHARYAYLLTLLLPLMSLYSHYPKSNLRPHRLASYLGEDLLMTPTARASLLVEEEDNELFILAYFINVLQKRADLKVFDPYANLFPQSYQVYFDIKNRRPPDRRFRSQVEKWTQIDANFRPAFYTIKPYLNAPLKSAGLMYYSGKPANQVFLTEGIWRFYHQKEWANVPLNYWSRYLVFTYPYHLGESLLKENRLKDAAAVLSPAYTKVKGMQWLAFNLGVIFQENGYYSQAINAYTEELNLGTINREAWINLGVAYNKLDQPKKALDAFEKAKEIKSSDADLINLIGNTLYRLGQHKKAHQYYEQAIKLNPPAADFHFNRALNMTKLNNSLANKLWRQFLTEFPSGIDPSLIEQARQHLKETQQ